MIFLSITIPTVVITILMSEPIGAGLLVNDPIPPDILTTIRSHFIRKRESGPNQSETATDPIFANFIHAENSTPKSRRPALNHTPSSSNVNFSFPLEMATSTMKTPTSKSISTKIGVGSKRRTTVPMPTDKLKLNSEFIKGAGDSGEPKVRNDECETCNGTKQIRGSGGRTILGAPPVVIDDTRILEPPPISVTTTGNSEVPSTAAASLVPRTFIPPGQNLHMPIHLPILVKHSNVTAAQAETENLAILCAFPPYSDRDTCISHIYFRDPLSKCEKQWALVLFVSVVKIIGVAIVAVNSLIVIVVFHDPKMRSQYHAIKVSLAVADMIIGILVLTALLPNIFSIRHLSEEQTVKMIMENANSPGSIIAGALLTVSKQASLLHLMFLSIERFLAIKWSMWHIGRKTKTVAAILVTIWIVSIICACTPAAFPYYFAYKFQPAVLLHMISLRPSPQLDWRGPVYGTFTLFLPYTITVTFCIMTGVVSSRKLRSSAQFFMKEITTRCLEDNSGTSPAESRPLEAHITKSKFGRKSLQPEMAVFVTLIIMITAFTITLLPFTIVLILLVVEVLDCTNYTIPYVVTFYIGLLNSLANGLIYSVRDEKFRKSAIKLMLSPTTICQSRNKGS